MINKNMGLKGTLFTRKRDYARLELILIWNHSEFNVIVIGWSVVPDVMREINK